MSQSNPESLDPPSSPQTSKEVQKKPMVRVLERRPAEPSTVEPAEVTTPPEPSGPQVPPAEVKEEKEEEEVSLVEQRSQLRVTAIARRTDNSSAPTSNARSKEDRREKPSVEHYHNIESRYEEVRQRIFEEEEGAVDDREVAAPPESSGKTKALLRRNLRTEERGEYRRSPNSKSPPPTASSGFTAPPQSVPVPGATGPFPPGPWNSAPQMGGFPQYPLPQNMGFPPGTGMYPASQPPMPYWPPTTPMPMQGPMYPMYPYMNPGGQMSGMPPPGAGPWTGNQQPVMMQQPFYGTLPTQAPMNYPPR